MRRGSVIGPSGRASGRVGLGVGLDHHQHPAGLDLVALGHLDRGHRAGGGGVDGVLHLHGLQHHQQLAGRHGVAHGHGHPDHAPGHGGQGRSLGRPGRRPAGSGPAPTRAELPSGPSTKAGRAVLVDPVVPGHARRWSGRTASGVGHRRVDLDRLAVDRHLGQGPPDAVEPVADGRRPRRRPAAVGAPSLEPRGVVAEPRGDGGCTRAPARRRAWAARAAARACRRTPSAVGQRGGQHA